MFVSVVLSSAARARARAGLALSAPASRLRVFCSTRGPGWTGKGREGWEGSGYEVHGSVLGRVGVPLGEAGSGGAQDVPRRPRL